MQEQSSCLSLCSSLPNEVPIRHCIQRGLAKLISKTQCGIAVLPALSKNRCDTLQGLQITHTALAGKIKGNTFNKDDSDMFWPCHIPFTINNRVLFCTRSP